MLRKCFFSVLALLVFIPVWGQTPAEAGLSWRKTTDHWARKNSLTVTTSLFGFSGYNAQAMPIFPVFNLEYDRMVYGNLSVSAIGFYAKLSGDRATDTYTLNENFHFAGAKVNYTHPLVRNWLYLRAGLGGGVGIHKATDYFMGEIAIPSAPAPNTSIKPHFLVDLYLVFRATPWLDLRVSPLLISPSQFLFGSKFNAPYNNRTYFYWNPVGTLGVSVRF